MVSPADVLKRIRSLRDIGDERFQPVEGQQNVFSKRVPNFARSIDLPLLVQAKEWVKEFADDAALIVERGAGYNKIVVDFGDDHASAALFKLTFA